MENGKKFLAMLVAAVIMLCCGFGGGMLASGIASGTKNADTAFQGTDGKLVSVPSNESGSTGGSQNAAAKPETTITINPSDTVDVGEAIAAKVMPTVVGITTVYKTSYTNFWGFPDSTVEGTGQGTGFIVDASGYIVTNSHVVNDGSYVRITVTLYSGGEYSGTVLWNDSTLDLAVIKIDASNLPVAELGDSDNIKLGSYAAALGNPISAEYMFTMTQGGISGLDRTITVTDGSYSSTTMEGLIQTDAAINPGNSGGPLVNSKGQVIGINSAKATSGESMGFAIPINTAKPIINQIKQTGSFKRVYIGITGVGLEESSGYNASGYLERYGTSRGIYIASITQGRGADAAGLKVGDIITEVDGVAVGTMNKINTVVSGHLDGDKVTVTYIRNKQSYTAEVVLMAEQSQ